MLPDLFVVFQDDDVVGDDFEEFGGEVYDFVDFDDFGGEEGADGFEEDFVAVGGEFFDEGFEDDVVFELGAVEGGDQEGELLLFEDGVQGEFDGFGAAHGGGKGWVVGIILLETGRRLILENDRLRLLQ